MILFPSSLINLSDLEPNAPMVSIAIGINVYKVESRELYLDLFLFSAKAATAPYYKIACCHLVTLTTLYNYHRLALAALHFNENIGRKQAVTKEGAE